MQRFDREQIGTHAPGVAWPDFLGRVALGERFVVATEQFNRVNGPIEVEGIVAGEAIAVHVEAIDIQPPFTAPNGGPFFEGMGEAVPLALEAGQFIFPNGHRLPARPSIGNVAVLPEPTAAIQALIQRDLGPPRERHRGWGWRAAVNDPRGRHCHQDCPALTAGATIHLKAQVDGAGLCLADVHGYIGWGETAFAGIEVAAAVTLRVERSSGWYVDWPLIETADEIMVFASDTNWLRQMQDEHYVDVVRRAYREMRKVVAARIGGTIADANPLVATALDIRNCALYGLGDFIQKERKHPAAFDQDIAVVGVMPKGLLERG